MIRAMTLAIATLILFGASGCSSSSQLAGTRYDPNDPIYIEQVARADSLSRLPPSQLNEEELRFIQEVREQQATVSGLDRAKKYNYVIYGLLGAGAVLAVVSAVLASQAY